MMFGYGGYALSPGARLSRGQPGLAGAWRHLRDCKPARRRRVRRGVAQGGDLERKQNVFDDFVAAAERLICEKITSPDELAIKGGSNGGLLIGAAIAAARTVCRGDARRRRHGYAPLSQVHRRPAVDARIRLPPIPRGSPAAGIHPITALSPAMYPATLVTTADHDDRVVPSHSFKFAAALQAAQGCDQAGA